MSFESPIDVASARPLAGSIRPAGPWGLAIGVIALATIALRYSQLGNPIAGLDEQFYLLMGDRMWHGVMPYVDIWDRKPAGLFLLYAGLRLLPGNGILAYQLAGCTCLTLTGAVVARITSRSLSTVAGIGAGMAVVLYGVVLGAGYGEAPIFYDLLTVIAGALVLAIRERPRADARFDPRSLEAMALCGLALTLKTSAIFECGCFGFLLIHDDWRRGQGWSACLGRACAYVAIGVAPTVTLIAFYALHGALDTYLFANFVSVFRRSGGTQLDSVARCVGFLLLLSPLILPALAEWRYVPGERRVVLTGWVIAGLLSFVALGRCYEHYALPLVTPLALLAGYGLRRRSVAIGACIVLMLTCLYLGVFAGAGGRARNDKADVAALRALIPAAVRTKCLFVYEGPVILYQLTGACLPGRYVFPGHFTEAAENQALEQPSGTILRATLARRPAVIVMAPASRGDAPLTANDRIVRAVLRDGYRPIGHQGVRLYGNRRIDVMVWLRKA